MRSSFAVAVTLMDETAGFSSGLARREIAAINIKANVKVEVFLCIILFRVDHFTNVAKKCELDGSVAVK